MEAWKADLWERHGRPRAVDPGLALRTAGLRADVHPRDVFASCYRDAVAAEAFAAANREHYGHPTLAVMTVEGGILGIVDLRPSLREVGVDLTDPALPDGAFR